MERSRSQKKGTPVIKTFIKYYRPTVGLFIFDMVCALIVALCDLVYPMIAKDLINVYVPDHQLNPLLIWSGVLLGIFLLKAALNFCMTYYGHIVGVRMQAAMRRDLFAHLQKLPFTYFDNNKTGTILSRLVNDLFEVSELAHHCPEDLFLSVIMFIGSFVMLASINLTLTLIVFAVLPFILFFAVKMRGRMNDAFRRAREQTGEINAEVETAISGMRVSRAYTAEEEEKAKFGRENSLYVSIRSHVYRVMAEFHTVMTLFTDILYLIVLCAGGLFFFYGKIDIGSFAAYLLYITMFLNPIKRFVSMFEQLQEGMTGYRRFREIMEVEPEEDADDAVDAGTLRGDIVFDDVSFHYEPGIRHKNEDGEESAKTADTAETPPPEAPMVLSHVSMHIPAGKTVALVGPSGGGKTTVCNLIPRFYELTEGRIEIDGRDITTLTRESLRRNIGSVAQDVFLFNGTVRENIAFGRPGATDAEVEAAAKAANIHEFIMSLPNGYETNVGERGVKLSGGQKQRVSIARVFLKDPPILILDEATSALDNATEMQIQHSLSELSHGRTVLVVAHRLSTVKGADEIIVFTQDGIAERGTHDALIAAGGLYKTLYSYQFRE